MDSDEKALEEIRKWIKSLTLPLPEQQLESLFFMHLTVQPFQAVDPAVRASALRELHQLNLQQVRVAVDTVCKEETHHFTSKSAIRQLAKAYPSGCFSNISVFTAVIEARAAEVIGKYIRQDSPLRSEISTEDFVLRYENELIECYRTAQVEDFSVLDVAYESAAVLPNLETAEVYEVDFLLWTEYEKCCEGLLRNLMEIANNQLPRTLAARYRSALKDKFISYGHELMRTSLASLRTIMERMLEVLTTGEDDMTLFDDRITSEPVRVMLFYAMQLAAGEVQTEVESAALFAAFLKLENCEMPDFHQRIENFRANIKHEQRAFIALCALLVLSRSCYRLCATMLSDTAAQYTPSIRQLYRRFLTHLFETKSQTWLFHVDEWYLGRTAEVVLAQALGALNHPLVAHVPAKVLEDMCRAGGPEKFAETTPQGEVRPLANFVRRAAADVLWIVNPQGAESQKQPITFLWESLKAEPALSSTIVISGWHSEKSDYFGDWKQLIDHPLQGTVMGLKWDADTATSFLWQTFVRTLAGVPFGYFSTALSAVSGSVQLFNDACKRAKRAGKFLAQNLAIDACGQGPVSLVGFSLGARVVYHCLKELEKRYRGRQVLDVILIAGAVENDAGKWAAVRPVVCGRMVNVLSNNDFVLRHCYRFATNAGSPAGLNEVAGFENFDASSYVQGHRDHRAQLADTLRLVNYQP